MPRPANGPKSAPPEPRALAGEIAFEEGDLHALSEPLAGDAQYDDRRLVLRRKLLTLGKAFCARPAPKELGLEPRSSLHNPTVFNGMRVRRIWSYVTRGKKEKSRLRRTLGPDLAKDLDAAFRNAYLCLAVESEAVEVSFRIHADAWYDGQNMKRRVEAEGARALLEVLNELGGFRARIADWKGEWPLGELGIEGLEELLGYYVPGERALAIERRWPAPASAPDARRALFAPQVPETLLDELERLVPLYRWAAWSQESDHLFG